MSDLISFSSEEKLSALRELDIFHHWDSLDEKRLCRRCGEIISGHEIKVVESHGRVHLECPTEGCPSVPMEWLMLELTAGDGEDEGVHTPKIAPGQDGGETPHQGRRFFPFSPPDF